MPRAAPERQSDRAAFSQIDVRDRQTHRTCTASLGNGYRHAGTADEFLQLAGVNCMAVHPRFCCSQSESWLSVVNSERLKGNVEALLSAIKLCTLLDRAATQSSPDNDKFQISCKDGNWPDGDPTCTGHLLSKISQCGFWPQLT